MREVDRVAVQMEECGGLDKMERLQHHDNEQVYQKVSRILDEFFSSEVSKTIVYPICMFDLRTQN